MTGRFHFRSSPSEDPSAEVASAILESLPDPVTAFDLSGHPLVFNRRAREVYGVVPRHVAQHEWAEYYNVYRADGTPFTPSDELPLFRAMRGEEVRDQRLLIAPGEGKPRLTSVHAAPIRFGGEPYGAVAVMREITDEAEAEPVRGLLASALVQMPNSLSLVSATDGTILYTNPAWDDTFGYASGEATGHHLSTVSVASDEAMPGERLREVTVALAQEGSWNGRVEQLRKDGERFWCSETIWQFHDDRAGPLWVIVYGERSHSPA